MKEVGREGKVSCNTRAEYILVLVKLKESEECRNGENWICFSWLSFSVCGGDGGIIRISSWTRTAVATTSGGSVSSSLS